MATIKELQDQLTECVRDQARLWDALRDMEKLISPEADIDGLDERIQDMATTVCAPGEFQATPTDVQDLLEWANADTSAVPTNS